MPEEVCDIETVDQERLEETRSSTPTEEQRRVLADTFKVLSHPTRLKILDALARDEFCVCDLAALLGASVSAVSHQLRLLRVQRLVRSRREGKRIYYALDDAHVRQLYAAGLEHVLEETSDDA